MENDQGSERARLNLTLTEAPIITSLTGGDVVATFKGKDPEGEDRFARFNLPQNQSLDDVYRLADKASLEGSIDLEGFWKTRRFHDAERIERTRLEFVITDLEPKREAAIQAGPATQAPPEAAREASPKPAAEAAAPDARKGSVALLATSGELGDAILQIREGKPRPGATPVARALAAYAKAIAQPQFEPAGDGKFKRTGEVLSGLPALDALKADFGAYKERNVYIDSGRAGEIAAGLGKDADILKEAQSLTAERRSENRAATKAPVESPAKADPKDKPASRLAAKAEDQKAAESGKAKAPPKAKESPSAIAHQSDPLILTASAGEIKAAMTSKAGLNSPVASTLRTFGAAVSQPEYRAKSGGGFEKTGKVFKGVPGLKMTLDGFGKGTYRNIMLDKAVMTDIMMAMPDTAKSNEAMAAALSASQRRREEMGAAKNAAKAKTKQRERDRD